MQVLGLVLCYLFREVQPPPLPYPLPSVKTKRDIQRCAALKEQVKKLKQWRLSTDYTNKDWVYLLKLARHVQTMPKNIVSEAMNSFDEIDTRPYLLLKVMFYRPLSPIKGYFGPNVGGIMFMEKVKDINTFDTPIDWSKGYPRFIASLSGGTGRRDGFRYHYLVLKRCYSLRKIKIPRDWERQANTQNALLHKSKMSNKK